MCDGVLRIWTWAHRMEGKDESTELCLLCVNILLKSDRATMDDKMFCSIGPWPKKTKEEIIQILMQKFWIFFNLFPSPPPANILTIKGCYSIIYLTNFKRRSDKTKTQNQADKADSLWQKTGLYIKWSIDLAFCVLTRRTWRWWSAWTRSTKKIFTARTSFNFLNKNTLQMLPLAAALV